MPRASPHRRKPAHLLLTLRARCIFRPEFSHGRSEASGRLGRIGTVRGHETSEDFASVRLEEIDLTDPGPGEVQVRVMACAVNFPDLTMVQGKRQHRGVAARPRRRRNGGGGTRQALRRQGHRHGRPRRQARRGEVPRGRCGHQLQLGRRLPRGLPAQGQGNHGYRRCGCDLRSRGRRCIRRIHALRQLVRIACLGAKVTSFPEKSLPSPSMYSLYSASRKA